MSRLTEIDGKPIVDAKRSVKLIITADDVKRADVKRPESCAVARACGRLHVDEARVHLSRVYLRKRGTWTRYITPRAVRSEIIAFDRGGVFEPGEYRLLAVNKTDKLGAKRKTGPKTVRGKKRAKAHVVTNVRTGPA